MTEPCPVCGHHTLYKPEGWVEGGLVVCDNPFCDSNHPEPQSREEALEVLAYQDTVADPEEYLPPQTTVIPDEMLGALILGWLRGQCDTDAFPIFVRGFAENYNPVGDVDSFTVITKSGLRFRVSVEMECRHGCRHSAGLCEECAECSP